MMILGKILAVFLIAALFIFFYSRFLEYKSLYYPTFDIEYNPKNYGIAYEDLFLSTEDGVKLNAWMVPSENARAAVIFAHGNGGNIGDRLEKMFFFHKLKVNFCIFDYRGYGKSQGRPGEQGFYKDIQAVYKYVKGKYPDLPIILYGESLGGAVVVDLASKHELYPVEGLILEGTFTNVKDMARLIYPMLPLVFLKTKFDSLNKIADVKAAKLHLHSRYDDIVPYALGKKLFAQAKDPKKFVELDGLHNDAFFVSESLVKNSIQEFISSMEKQ
jgi:fermentation-respiration switch protein FrsA (DUF1100 family)